MTGSAEKRNKNKHCHYHEDVGHDTNDCFSLKQMLNRLADKGALKSYVKSKVDFKSNLGKSTKKTSQPAISSKTDYKPVYTKAGRFAGGGPTIRGKKDRLRKMVHYVDGGQAARKSASPEVIITEKERGEFRRPHDDLVVIECKVANQFVGRILINTGSSIDIISRKCLSNLKYRPGSMMDVSHLLVGFGGGVVHPVGRIDLPIRMGEKGSGRHMTIRFLVVEELNDYNLILGQTTLNKCKAVMIPALMLVKYEKDDGIVGSLNGDQKTA
ncbi:uncharacterized protein LOC110709340 [Chenopodium quinoa]|uniref:uncharacterized protein LOC110709340 n=1 Tax=Chenopodium quinoa TaxID=63459 RepID=UPI000B7970A2|nr:uncharacterized protein LOC110709340 [Chenopodium quinoa]